MLRVSQGESGFKSRSAPLYIPNFHASLGPSVFKKASLFPVFKHLLLAFSTREPNFLLFITVLLKRAVLYLLCVSSLHMTLETWCRVHTPVFLEKLPRDILVAKSTGTSVSLSFIFTSPIHLMLLTIPCLKFSSSLVSVL